MLWTEKFRERRMEEKWGNHERDCSRVGPRYRASDAGEMVREGMEIGPREKGGEAMGCGRESEDLEKLMKVDFLSLRVRPLKRHQRYTRLVQMLRVLVLLERSEGCDEDEGGR
jgi:hypothetical protein